MLLPLFKKKSYLKPPKGFFHFQSLLTALRFFFLQVIKLIKILDKTNSEMVLMRPLGDSPGACVFLCSNTVCAVAKTTCATHRRASIQLSQRCLSTPVHPISWSQPNGDLQLVIQLPHLAGLHPLGLLLRGPVVPPAPCSESWEPTPLHHAHFPF